MRQPDTERWRGPVRLLLMIPPALVSLIFVRLSLTLTTYRHISRWLPVARGRARPHWIPAVRTAVSVTAYIVPGASCLTQALAARFILALIGQSTLIRVGVRRQEDGSVLAHAWLLDHRNRIIVGGSPGKLAHFTPLTDLRDREAI
jgi:hypothetical protein